MLIFISNYGFQEFKITDMKFFLEQVERLHLCMELWQHKGEETSKRYLLRNMEALGVALLPMHPFYTAFHNKTKSDRIHETKVDILELRRLIDLQIKFVLF